MNVLMLNAFDDVGGAARGTVRLLRGVRAQGVEARLLVQFKGSGAEEVMCDAGSVGRWLRRLKLYLGILPVRRYPNRPENNFSPALMPDRLPAAVARRSPDLVHLNWLGAGMCRVETLPKLPTPLVWTLRDSWAFTGGCHVPHECTKYRERCGACPVLGSTAEQDLSRSTWKRKDRTWRDLRVTLVAPSRWMADCARSSSLLGRHRVEVIPNGLDTGVFQPRDRSAARQRLGVPPGRRVILFGAVNATVDPNKGWHLLQPALRLLAGRMPDTEAAVFGSRAPAETPDVGMPVRFLGPIGDEPALADAYAAADVFVAPSLQEAFCQTAAESLACGTPVAAFGCTGLLDVVTHGEDGYLARPHEVEDLARGLAWVLEDPARRAELGRRARRNAVERFDLASVARRYVALYREVLASPTTGGAG